MNIHNRTVDELATLQAPKRAAPRVLVDVEISIRERRSHGQLSIFGTGSNHAGSGLSGMCSTVRRMDFILIPGLWLDGSAWTEVTAELERSGHHARPLTLPGQGDGSATATLEDQLAAVVAAIDEATDPVVVGHSAACSLAWMATDRRPGTVRRVVLVGGFPANDGDSYADFFPITNGVMPFPGWDPFEGPDSADLDQETRQRLAANAIAVPEAVAEGRVTLGDDRRFNVPVTIVCPEFTPEQAQATIDGGEVPELAAPNDVSFVNIDSGHWPMFTRARELAGLLGQATLRETMR
jgi:pimeloyl-ACP methyl ester carboxylesterase